MCRVREYTCIFCVGEHTWIFSHPTHEYSHTLHINNLTPYTSTDQMHQSMYLFYVYTHIEYMCTYIHLHMHSVCRCVGCENIHVYFPTLVHFPTHVYSHTLHIDRSKHQSMYLWRICMCDVTHSARAMTYSCTCHDKFICVTWRIHNVWHDAFTCVTWRIHMCDIAHSYVWRDSFIYVWRDAFI